RGGGGGGGGELAAGPARVLDNNRAPEPLAELDPDEPADHVGDAAGRKRHDHVDVLRRIGLSRCRLGNAGKHKSAQRESTGVLECGHELILSASSPDPSMALRAAHRVKARPRSSAPAANVRARVAASTRDSRGSPI